MAAFFADVSDDEISEHSSAQLSDHEEGESEQAVTELEGFEKWRKREGKDDEGELDNVKVVKSNKAKAIDNVEEKSDEFDFIDFEDPNSWQTAHSKFTHLCELATQCYAKYKKLPPAFAGAIDMLKEAMETHQDSVEEKSAKARSFLTQLRKAVDNYERDNADLLEDLRMAPDDEEEDIEMGEDEDAELREDEEWTVESVKAFFADPISKNPKVAAAKCKRVITATQRPMTTKSTKVELTPAEAKAKRKGVKGDAAAEQQKEDTKKEEAVMWPSLEVTAHALHCQLVLQAAPSTGPTTSAWRTAYRSLVRSMETAQTHGISVSESGKMHFDRKQATVFNGWSSLAVSLADACVKAVQNQPEYRPVVDRIQDEALAASVLDRCVAYYTSKGNKKGTAACAAALLDILYVRTAKAHKLLSASVPRFAFLDQDAASAVDALVGLVHSNSNDAAARKFATLAHVYHLAVRGDFHRARDVFIAANIYPDVEADEAALLVRYNRVVAQLGLCAFRKGFWTEALLFWENLMQKKTIELRELLGQSDFLRSYRRYDEDVITTITNRARLVPPHHAFQLSLLEHAHLVLLMLNDVIAEAKAPDERPQRSKQFFGLCKRFEMAVYHGKPRTDNEHVHACYEALLRGDMNAAIAELRTVSSWQYLPDDSNTVDLLVAKMRQDALKVFLISRGAHYASLSVQELTTRFGLAADAVRSIVSRLLLDGTITGHWDPEDAHVVIERGPQSRFHTLAREACDRVAAFAEYIENPNAAAPTGRDRGRGTYSFAVAGRGRGRGRGSY